MKKVLFAASEAVPFIKTGGLADVVGSLPKYFPKTEYDVRVVFPKYLCMDSRFCENMEFVGKCQVQLNWRSQYAGIYRLEKDGITCYLIDNEYYFAGPAPYGQIYQDAEKFGFFSKAVLTILPEIGFCPDIIHCHDWQTGLIPVFLETQFRQKDFYRYIKTVYTIHNLKFQGRWHIDAIRDVTGLDDSYFTMDKLESYGDANLLKGGVVFADLVTTVSETYAKEIQTTEGGEGLEGLLRAQADRLRGILNGIDYKIFDPAADPLIAETYGGDVLSFKRGNKADLQRSLGLAEDADAFLIGMVSRLTDQKGFDLVDYILDEILGDGRIQLVVLGTGEQRYEDMFRHFAGKYPGRISANICYSEELAHKIYASCDAFLMPSLFEPCGLSQMMSLRYGAVPIVRETGGLKDTVEPYNEFEHTGTGFRFHNYNAHEMLFIIRYACKIFYQEPQEWLDIIRRGMAQDYSWTASSDKYAQLYDELYQRTLNQKEEERLRAEEEQKRIEAEKRAEEEQAEEEQHAAAEKRAEEEQHTAAEKRAEEEQHAAEEKRTEEEQHAAAEKRAEEEQHTAEEKRTEEEQHTEAEKRAKEETHNAKPKCAAGKPAGAKEKKAETQKTSKSKTSKSKTSKSKTSKSGNAEKKPTAETSEKTKKTLTV